MDYLSAFYSSEGLQNQKRQAIADQLGSFEDWDYDTRKRLIKEYYAQKEGIDIEDVQVSGEGNGEFEVSYVNSSGNQIDLEDVSFVDFRDNLIE
jgi:hypothetical protein